MITFLEPEEQHQHKNGGGWVAQQLTDLQNAVAALQGEVYVVLVAIQNAVASLVALEAQVAALQNGTTDPDGPALEALAASVNQVTSDLSTAVANLGNPS